MREHLGNPPQAHRWLARGAMTLASWVVAFLVIMALLTVFGDELESLPLTLRALVISGVLTVLMANLVMPVLSVAITRWGPMRRRATLSGATGGPDPRLAGESGTQAPASEMP
jgi:antibiotic biosynthesis monooxygenase (ABM) superfamily enzyme